MPTCQLCGQLGVVLHDHLADQLYGTPGRWTLKRCPACEFAWIDPPPTGGELATAYGSYYTHAVASDTLAFWRRLYRRLLNLTPVGRERQRLALMCLDQEPPGRLLDIGCGNGQRLVELHRLGWEVEGQEIDSAAAATARQFGLRIHLGPVEEITGTFDAIIMNHVIEHVPDPIATLRECHRLLRAGGQLVASTPNVASYGHRKFGARWRGLEPPRHLHLFTPSTLLRVAKSAGFVECETWSTSARAAGFARGSGASLLATAWFQATAYFQRDGEECFLRATK